uniref:Large ribosomal subunit protein uL3 n=1 Tax=Aerophobetes bacterium TaxID=2030807 RepID=A0A2A4YMZ3_UNCAE
MSLKFAGRKKGMTKIFDESGEAVVCTVLELEPNVITQVKTKEKEGYSALQMGGITLPASRKKNLSKPMQGHFASKKVEPKKVVFESRVEDTASYEVGQALTVEYFQDAKFVDVTGTSKGKGYQGVMKRHGFKGGPAAHGSGFHRHAGSTGMRSTPGRTFKNLKMPGHMGNEKVTAECLHIVRVDIEKHLLLVKGCVPGPRDGIIFVRKSVKKAHKQA